MIYFSGVPRSPRCPWSGGRRRCRGSQAEPAQSSPETKATHVPASHGAAASPPSAPHFRTQLLRRLVARVVVDEPALGLELLPARLDPCVRELGAPLLEELVARHLEVRRELRLGRDLAARALEEDALPGDLEGAVGRGLLGREREDRGQRLLRRAEARGSRRRRGDGSGRAARSRRCARARPRPASCPSRSPRGASRRDRPRPSWRAPRRGSRAQAKASPRRTRRASPGASPPRGARGSRRCSGRGPRPCPARARRPRSRRPAPCGRAGRSRGRRRAPLEPWSSESSAATFSNASPFRIRAAAASAFVFASASASASSAAGSPPSAAFAAIRMWRARTCSGWSNSLFRSS